MALEERMPALPGHVLAGFSGGCDSTALMRLLIRRREKTGMTLEAVHVNHGLRGEASDGDEAFVRAFCEQWGVSLHVCRAVPGEGCRSEAWAREARYGFFREVMRATGADALVLAHHRDDQAETMLLHLLRGSGLDGLAGMRFDRMGQGMRLLRPLLGFSHRELEEALTQAGQGWREDESNSGDGYLRNRIRHQLLPQMEALAPGAAERLAVSARILSADADALNAQAEAHIALSLGRPYLPLESLLRLPEALLARAVRLWWQSMAGEREERNLDAAQTARVLSLLSGPPGTRLSLPGGTALCRGYTHLHFLPGTPRPAFTEEVPLADGTRACGCLFQVSVREGPGDGKTGQAFPEGSLDGLVIRTRRPGDCIRPFGQAGRQKLKEYLIDRKVDQPFRDILPLICRGSEVLVVCGVGTGAVQPVTAGGKSLYVSWRPDEAACAFPFPGGEDDQEGGKP